MTGIEAPQHTHTEASFNEFLKTAEAKLTTTTHRCELKNGTVTEPIEADLVLNKEGQIDPTQPLVVFIGGGDSRNVGLLPIMGEMMEYPQSANYNLLGIPHFAKPDVRATRKSEGQNEDGKTNLIDSFPKSEYAENVLAGMLGCSILTDPQEGQDGKSIVELLDPQTPLVIVGQSNGALVGMEILVALEDKLSEARQSQNEAEVARLEAILNRDIRFVGMNPAGTYDEVPFKHLREIALRSVLIEHATKVLRMVGAFAFNTTLPRKVEKPYSWIDGFDFFQNRSGFSPANNKESLLKLMNVCALDSLARKIARFVNRRNVSFDLIFGKNDTVFRKRFMDTASLQNHPEIRYDEIEGKHEAVLVPPGNKEAAQKITQIVCRQRQFT